MLLILMGTQIKGPHYIPQYHSAVMLQGFQEGLMMPRDDSFSNTVLCLIAVVFPVWITVILMFNLLIYVVYIFYCLVMKYVGIHKSEDYT